jgi:hypothetical protein
MLRAAVFLAALLVAQPTVAQRYQCVGRASAENGAQAHAILYVDGKGEREDGIIAWTPPTSAKTGLPFTIDLLYGIGSLETGTFFNPASLAVNLSVSLDPPPARSLKAAAATPTSGSRIIRPWRAFDDAVAAGARRPMDGIITFSAGDGSDGIFYAIEDKDPTLTVDILGDAGAVIARQVFDLSATGQRDALAGQAFQAAGKLAGDPPRACQIAR